MKHYFSSGVENTILKIIENETLFQLGSRKYNIISTMDNYILDRYVTITIIIMIYHFRNANKISTKIAELRPFPVARVISIIMIITVITGLKNGIK